MKAAVHTAYGPPRVVRILDVDKPAPGRDEVLVKVHAATVNRTDCAFRSGTPRAARVVYGPLRPRATVLGSEFAGVVEAIGIRVSRQKLPLPGTVSRAIAGASPACWRLILLAPKWSDHLPGRSSRGVMPSRSR